MEELINMKYVINAFVYSGIGLLVFMISYILLDLTTPKVSIWKELTEKQNVAVAIFFGAFNIGIAMIISAAIHG